MRNVAFILGSVVALAACSSGGGTSIAGAGNTPASGTETAATPGEERPPGDEGTTVPKSVTAKLAAVEITEVAVFQAVKATIAKGGTKATPGVPLVAQRDALVRVYVKGAPKGTPLKAILRLVDADGNPLKAFSDTKALPATSSDASLESTFNFNVPGSALPLGTKYAVAITDESADPIEEGEENKARFPVDGSEVDVGVKSAGPSLRVVLVPVKYTADGSGRLPDTSPAQVKLLRDAMWSQYPTPDVEITVRQPYTWSRQVAPNGTGWDTLLDALVSLRENDGADDDVYYWGAFVPASSSQSFCGGGCVAGLSSLVTDPRNSFLRASIGLGFKGGDSAETMVHEIGHAHGRSHAPCSEFGGIGGPDQNFPHSGGLIGAWGYDMSAKKLRSPTAYADFMGYCNPSWISDYTYKALFDRVSTVNRGKALPPVNNSAGSSGGSGSFQFVRIDQDGPASFGQVLKLRSTPYGTAHEVQLLDAQGAVKSVVRGDYFPYDHLPGGMLLVPETGISYSSIRVSGYGRTLSR